MKSSRFLLAALLICALAFVSCGQIDVTGVWVNPDGEYIIITDTAWSDGINSGDYTYSGKKLVLNAKTELDYSGFRVETSGMSVEMEVTKEGLKAGGQLYGTMVKTGTVPSEGMFVKEDDWMYLNGTDVTFSDGLHFEVKASKTKAGMEFAELTLKERISSEGTESLAGKSVGTELIVFLEDGSIVSCGKKIAKSAASNQISAGTAIGDGYRMYLYFSSATDFICNDYNEVCKGTYSNKGLTTVLTGIGDNPVTLYSLGKDAVGIFGPYGAEKLTVIGTGLDNADLTGAYLTENDYFFALTDDTFLYESYSSIVGDAVKADSYVTLTPKCTFDTWDMTYEALSSYSAWKNDGLIIPISSDTVLFVDGDGWGNVAKKLPALESTELKEVYTSDSYGLQFDDGKAVFAKIGWSSVTSLVAYEPADVDAKTHLVTFKPVEKVTESADWRGNVTTKKEDAAMPLPLYIVYGDENTLSIAGNVLEAD
ncbi:MAG: hypothetical protein MJ183_09465 [Treponemataceae bacterium]|nr:hypothetical protein [Treponemataceae bacterium]